jgi:FAD/FMN-containing dehydrogenase
MNLHAGRSAPVEPLTNFNGSPSWAEQAYESEGMLPCVGAAGSTAIIGGAVAAMAIGPPGVSSGGKTIDMSAKNR